MMDRASKGGVVPWQRGELGPPLVHIALRVLLALLLQLSALEPSYVTPLLVLPEAMQGLIIPL